MTETNTSGLDLDEIEWGIIEYQREWQDRLDLQHWDIDVLHDLKDHLGTCEAQPQYMTAVLRFNIDRIQKEIKTDRKLEELVLHELVHCRVWALANMYPDSVDKDVVEYFEEEAVTQITGALLRAKYNGK